MTPSIKTIETGLNIERDTAKQIRGIMDGSIDPENYESVKILVSQCFSSPWLLHKQLTAINELLEGYGLEAIGVHMFSCDLEYVNMGDTYINTVCFHNDRFKITSWGDIVESNPELMEENYNE